MKTSNKLLLGVLIVMLLCVTVVLGAAKYYALDASVVTTPRGAPQPPAVPEAPAPPAAE
ncbi:hypothetical protein [Pontibacter diazotrophicus]|nr:hypothetical protein [Pontibacter diazotrophicus]